MPFAPRSAAGVAWLVALAVARPWLEARLVTHLLVLLPGLVLAGVLLAPDRTCLSRVDPLGIARLTAGVLVCAGWMLPRALDAALTVPALELARWLSLPAAGAVALAPGWRRLPAVARAFVVANAWSMLLLGGWLYLTLPARLCSYYLASGQHTVGLALLAAAALLGLWAAARAIGGPAGYRTAGFRRPARAARS